MKIVNGKMVPDDAPDSPLDASNSFVVPTLPLPSVNAGPTPTLQMQRSIDENRAFNDSLHHPALKPESDFETGADSGDESSESDSDSSDSQANYKPRKLSVVQVDQLRMHLRHGLDTQQQLRVLSELVPLIESWL
jgi:hypothetical protein